MVLERKLSLEDYFELEKNLEVRHEFVDGELIEMAGTTKIHNKIIRNMMVALDAATRREGCELYSETIKLQTTSGKIRYPDIMLCCQPSEDAYLETSPCFIAEILSESTETTDYTAKVREYLALANLEGYAIIAQTERLVVLYERRGDEWRYKHINSGSFEIPCLNTSLTVDAICEGIEFISAFDSSSDQTKS